MGDLRSLSGDWPVISRRLDEALELAPEPREKWLDALQETDSIKRTLRRLLQDPASIETGEFFDVLPKLTLGPGDIADRACTHEVQAGAQVGPYRLIRELGVGGMGLVWLAERIDGRLKRHVALKLPRLSWSKGLAERMNRERDILVSLDHPNIAHIHDAGVDEQGRPYLALEFVKGEAIDAYCRRLELPVRERLGIVLQVARAVAHAHARLVVHRDLKPANILVTSDGQVRLLDFGIAKLLEGDSTRETQLTRHGGRPLTPEYASPEQIRGEPIGTASDVYSLGLVTYELLTRAKAYPLKRDSAAALEEAILSADPPLASTACAGQAARQALRGDLDAILNKALKKNPDERYSTVDALIADIECQISHRPVQAQPDRWRYRTAKFLRRHRVPVSLGSAAAIALLASVSIALWQAHGASQQRDRALSLLSRSEAVTEFMQMFVTETAQANRPVNLGDLLARSETLADKQFRDAPEQRAVVLAMLGMYRRTLGDGAKAEALLKRAVDSARGSNDPSLKARLDCQYASTVELLGRIDEARRALIATASRTDIDAEAAADCYSYLAYLSQNINDGPASVDYARQALQRLQASHRPSMSQLASFTSNLAYGLHLNGRNGEADQQFSAALRMFEQAGRDTSAESLAVRNNWGLVSLGSGDIKTAVATYAALLNLLTREGGGEAPPFVLANRARALDLSGRYSDAMNAYALAAEAADKSGSPPTRAYCLLGMGFVARETGDLDRAQSFLAQVERMDASARPAGGPVAVAEHLLRGRIALSRGDLPLARSAFTLALGERKPNASTVGALTGRAEVALRAGQFALASTDAQEALQMAQALQGGTPYSVRTGLAWLVLADIRAQSGGMAAAHEAAAAAVLHLDHTVDAMHPGLQRARSLAAERVLNTVSQRP